MEDIRLLEEENDGKGNTAFAEDRHTVQRYERVQSAWARVQVSGRQAQKSYADTNHFVRTENKVS